MYQISRNQVAFTGSWVRIPPLPPGKHPHLLVGMFCLLRWDSNKEGGAKRRKKMLRWSIFADVATSRHGRRGDRATARDKIPPLPPGKHPHLLVGMFCLLRWDSNPERVRSVECNMLSFHFFLSRDHFAERDHAARGRKTVRRTVFSSEVRSGCAARTADLRSNDASHRFRRVVADCASFATIFLSLCPCSSD